MTIRISLNNESIEMPDKMLLSDAIEQWGFANSKIAVAINGEFVPRSTYAEKQLAANDKIDIVKPVGGG